MEQEQTEQKHEESKTRRGPGVQAFVVAFVILIILFAIIDLATTSNRRSELYAVKRLRYFGSAELAYQGRSSYKKYGTFRELQKQGVIPEDETLRDLIPQYHVIWTTPDYTEFDQKYGNSNMTVSWYNAPFTIIAYPYHPAKLHTFLITEDQVIREFSPEKGNKPDAVHSWTPTQLQ